MSDGFDGNLNFDPRAWFGKVAGYGRQGNHLFQNRRPGGGSRLADMLTIAVDRNGNARSDR